MKIGWREWASLPELGIKLIKVKVDTGARTSALHTSRIELFEYDNENWIRFWFESSSKKPQKKICEAAIKDQREVTSSSGESELRYVIETDIIIGRKRWPIEMTLTNRKTMKYRMLLGRHAMKKLTVIPHKHYLQKQPLTGIQKNENSHFVKKCQIIFNKTFGRNSHS